MSLQSVDVVILGAGGGGYPAAFFLAKAGLRVVMADPYGNLGGNCLFEGCIPSKAVREVSLMRSMAGKYRGFGLRGEIPAADWKGVLAHKDHVQRIRFEQHAAEIRESGVVFHRGHGRILDERRVEIEAEDGAYRYDFRNLIVATGSRPRRLPISGQDLVITSHDLFRPGTDLPFPSDPVIIGGGYIGIEAASMLNNLGARPVILEYTDQLLPGFDPELADFLHRRLVHRARIELNVRVTAIEKDGSRTLVRYTRQGEERSAAGDAVLMSIGREPVLPEGMEKLDLPVRGPLTVDDRLQTAVAHVYAPGDVNGRNMLFHSAVRQSLVAAHNIAAGGQPADRMDFESVPFTVFTEPELAKVGLTEAQARARYGSVEIARYDYAQDSRAQILDETEGFIKLVFDSGTGRLLGAQIAGIEASQLIAPLTLAVNQGLGAVALTQAVFPHPMISEGINKAARSFRS